MSGRATEAGSCHPGRPDQRPKPRGVPCQQHHLLHVLFLNLLIVLTLPRVQVASTAQRLLFAADAALRPRRLTVWAPSAGVSSSMTSSSGTRGGAEHATAEAEVQTDPWTPARAAGGQLAKRAKSTRATADKRTADTAADTAADIETAVEQSSEPAAQAQQAEEEQQKEQVHIQASEEDVEDVEEDSADKESVEQGAAMDCLSEEEAASSTASPAPEAPQAADASMHVDLLAGNADDDDISFEDDLVDEGPDTDDEADA